MAPNGTSRKTPVVSAKPRPKQNKLFGELFDDVDSDSTKENLAMSGVKKAGSWADSARSSPATSTATANAVAKVSSPISKAMPNSITLPDRSDFQKCQHCKRAVSRSGMPKHIESCLNKKQEKQRKKKEAKDARDAAARKEKNAANGIPDSDEDDEADGEGKKTTSATKTGLGSTTSKKRKAGDPSAPDETPDTTGPAKKKSKKSGSGPGDASNAKGKAARPKAPVDVEKQCGVELPQGGQCARSLTCKSHSMGAKRAVPGRSAPYDKLLMEYQRKNQAKLQKEKFDANAPDPGDEELAAQGPVDSEDEKEAVMGAVARAWGGRPIWQSVRVPLRERYKVNRIRGLLQGAFGGGQGGGGGGGGGGLFSGRSTGGFFGSATASSTTTAASATATAASASGSATTAPVIDDNGVVHARKGSIVPGARSMMAPMASRKPGVATATSNSNANSASASTVAVGA